MRQLVLLPFMAFMALRASGVEEIVAGDVTHRDTSRILAEMRAAQFATRAGRDTAPMITRTIMLNVPAYAALTGQTLEDMYAKHGYKAAYEVVGVADCSVDAKGPHAGEVDLGFGIVHTWVKAKAWARCSFTWTGPGYHFPPYIDWNLHMLLVRDPAWWKWWGAYARYSKRGTLENNYQVTFWPTESGRSGTQVWFNYCENDEYENRVGVWVSVPWPWIVLSIGPAGYDTHRGDVVDC